ncbi:MAG: hypothetical protein LBM28_06210 [Oscillospiraceae bacterium]|jgi:hypothetical protein|nr:hypothetical protein [Oscillospiraceae bacterium]
MKKLLAFALALLMLLSLAACGGKDADTPNGESPALQGGDDNAANVEPNSVEAAFAQFGLNLEDIKPGIGTANEIALEYGNNVSDTVYYREAYYTENAEAEIDEAVGIAYNQKMFDLCKAASADGKIYKNKTAADGDPDEVASYDELVVPSAMIQMITWSYKVDGIWVDVYMDWGHIGDEIGIQLGGSGTY